MPFPNQVRAIAGTAWEGDFASHNPNLYSMLAGQGQMVAAPAGVLVGHFAWLVGGYVSPESNTLTSVAAGNGSTPAGFIARELQGMIITYLAEGTMQVQPGTPLTAYTSGDFWALNQGVACARGNKVWTRLTDGAVGVSATGDGTDLAGGAVAWQLTKWYAAAPAANATLVKITSTIP